MTAIAARLLSAATASVLALGAAGCGVPEGQNATQGAGGGSPGSGSAPRAASSQPPARSSTQADGFTSPRTFREVALPVRIRIPSKDIDSRLGGVGLEPDGTIGAPEGYQQAAWYERGPRPGQNGPAVIVGHVDSRLGPAVFFRLGELRKGQAVLVDRADGTTVRFRVTQRQQYAKAAFPASDVYSPTLKPSLLLITCGGTFDRSTGHYRDNVVVTAVPG